MSNMTIELKTDYVVIHTISSDGTQQEKIVDNASFKQALSTIDAPMIETTPLLPGEYGTQRIISTGHRTRILYLEPPAIRRITFHDDEMPEFREDYYRPEEWDVRKKENDETDADYQDYLREEFTKHQNAYYREHGNYEHKLMIVVPRTLWQLDVKQSSGVDMDILGSSVYAMKQSVYTGQEELYKCPTANVFPDNRICWGYNTVRLPNLKAVQGIPSYFFSSAFNRDLNVHRFNSERGLNSFLSLARYMDRKLRDGVSPEDLLDEVHRMLSPINKTFNRLTE